MAKARTVFLKDERYIKQGCKKGISETCGAVVLKCSL